MQTKFNTILWVALALAVTLGFSLLGVFGREIYRQAPPIPSQVVSESGEVLFDEDQILDGQQVWQSIGGQQIGSIWGHGAYQAPDWSADWLHREAELLLDHESRRRFGLAFAQLDASARATLEVWVREQMRTNTLDPATGVVMVSDARARAIGETAAHYEALFGGADELAQLREDYALHDDAVTDPERLRALSAFFYWAAWACITERPGLDYSYTNNWPHDPLLGNEPTTANLAWSVVSVFLLLAGVGALVWFLASRRADDEPQSIPREDPLQVVRVTPSMRALGKYLAVVVALFLFQVLLGGLTAHYTIEGDSFFGLPIAEYLPYAVTRTWHLQTAMFWIATAFLAAGLFLAPLIRGAEPSHQRLGVNLLFAALVLVVGGSLAGEWLSIQQWFDLDLGFWFGHQGYEYVELGRAWQIALFAGLVLWLVLMVRAVLPRLRERDDARGLLLLLTGSFVAIGLMYGAGLFYGARSNLAVAEYWRWWVVHLWVEGFFEVFATGTMAFLFHRLGLVGGKSATRAFIASTTMFLLAGIPGTFHHIYFSGTPVSVTAVGSVFSALEVVPLVLIGREAVETLRMGEGVAWMQRYRWPIRFFVGVAFWNLVGAGLFGFLINPPIALYYMQGLNTTPVHAHTALFGVYGLLGLGFVLIIARKLSAGAWKTRALGFSFWAMNLGLGLMVVLSLLPIGLLQTWASAETGLWYARSAEFMQQPALELLRWLRIVGDTVFLAGAGAFAYFMLGLRTGWSLESEPEPRPAGDGRLTSVTVP